MDVADAFLAAHPQLGPAQAETVDTVAICVGQSLADRGRPGEWESIEIADLFSAVPGRHVEQVAFATTLVEMLSWMANARWLHRDRVDRYLDEIEGHGPRGADVRAAVMDARRRMTG